MAEWKKVIVSGSDAILNDINISGTFTGDGSGITGIVNASIASNAAIAHTKLAALAATKVLVGNGSNVATEVALSGDVTMDNAGAVTIANTAVTNAMIGDGAVDTEEIADDAVTAAKLASNAVVNASIAANAAIAHSKLAALASTKVLVGNGSNVAVEVALSGDVTMDNAGAVTIANTSVTNAMIGDGAVDTEEIADDAITAAKLASNAVVNASIAANAAIAHTKLAALAATKVLVGNGSNVATEVPLSGDVTMNNAGAVTIGAGVVETAMIANNAVDGDKLADSVTVAAELTVAGHGLTVKQISASAHISGTLAGDIIGFASGSFLNVEASNDIKAAQFYGGGAGITGVSTDIDGLDALGGTGVAQGDHFMFSDAGTEKKITFSNLEDAIFGNVSGDATVAAGGALTIANTSVETGMIADDAVTAAKLASNAVVNASIASNAAIAHTKLAALAATKVLVGNGSNVATEVALSGDVTMDNAGAVTIANTSVTNAMIGDGAVDTEEIADDAVTAAKVAANAIVNASIASNAAIAHTKLAALAATKVLVGNGSNVATEVALSGDVTMDNAGAVTIGADTVTYDMMQDTGTANRVLGATSAGTIGEVQVVVAMMAANSVDSAQYVDGSIDTAHIAAAQVTTAKIADDAVTAAKLASNAVVNASIASNAAIAHTKLAALAATKVLVGNGSNVATEVALSGDVTMNNAGAVTIGAGVVETAMIANNAVDGDKLADSIVIAADLTVTGDFLVSGDSVTVNTANLAIEDPFILLKSGSSNTTDSGIIFGGSTGAVNTGKAIVWDASYNDNDGRLAVSTTAVAANATANFGAGTAGYYVAGAFLGSAANAATALADHAGNIRIESSEIYIYV